MNLQPTDLQTKLVKLEPLKETDFNALFAAASDPLIWNQHPNPLRFQLDHFTTFFEGAMQSKGAFVIKDTWTNSVIGSSRFYDWDKEKKSIFIGYTFISRDFWGKGYNYSMKIVMMEFIFQFVDTVYFQIGAANFRSQKAISKLGAIKIGEEEVQYYKEDSKLNYLYCIDKKEFYKIF